MNLKKYVLFWIIILIIIILLLVFINTNNQKEDTIKVGYISPMSGSASAYGEHTRKAFKIGINEWNSNNINKKIKVIYEDGKCASADAVTAANKLINIDDVDIIMTFCTGETNAVIPLTEENNKILLTAGTTSPKMLDGKYRFRNIASVANNFYELSKLAYKHDTKIALISESTDYAFSSKDVFKKYFLDLGGVIIIDETFESNNPDFRTIISKLKEKDVNSLFVIVQSLDNSGLLFKQMKELNYYPQIYSELGAISSVALDKYSKEGYLDVVEGTIFAQQHFDITTNTKAKHLFDVYISEYGSTKGPCAEYYLATSYDAVYLIGEAFLNVGKDPDNIKEYFLNNIKDWDGAIGLFSFNENGDSVVEVDIKIVKNGQIEEVVS